MCRRLLVLEPEQDSKEQFLVRLTFAQSNKPRLHWLVRAFLFFKHGSPAETKPDSTICTQGVKMDYILLDPKLHSKVWQIKQRRSWIHSVNQALSSEGIPQAKTIDGI